MVLYVDTIPSIVRQLTQSYQIKQPHVLYKIQQKEDINELIKLWISDAIKMIRESINDDVIYKDILQENIDEI